MKKTGQLAKRNLIGGRVKRARLACRPRITQDALAGRLAAAGVLLDQTAISRIENQTRYIMDYEAAALARCLRVSVAYLFGETDRGR